LRNGTPFTSYAAAVDAITGGTEQDGVLKLARYTQSGDGISGKTNMYNTNGEVRTIFGIRHSISGGTGTSGWTIYNSYDEVIKNIQYQIDTIAGGGDGSIAQQIANALDALDYSGVTTGDGVVVTNVTETDGKVSATAAEVGGLKLTNYAKGSDSGAVVATDSINAAISKLENQVDAVKAEKDAAIEALDYTDTAVTGSYVSKVDETNGVISVTREALPTVAAISEAGKPITAVSESLGEISATAGTINAEFVNVADAGNLFSSTTVEATLAEIVDKYTAADAALKTEILGGASTSADTLGELEALINNLDADAATYTIRKDTESLPAEIKERYTLVETKNGQSTDKQVTIDIPKDSHIVSIEFISDSGDTHYQNLKYTYVDVNGAEQEVYVNMANLVFESEFQSGVTATDGIVHGVVDSSSEKGPDNNPFLTVGASGFKLDGVQKAIDTTSNNVKAKLDELSGKTVTGVEMTGGTAVVDEGNNGTKKITINTDGSQIKATGYVKDTDGGAIAATDTINAALSKLENQVAAAKTKVAKDAAASHITLTSSTDSDGSVTYTIGESDIASKSDLDAEIEARKAVDGQSGQTYAANTSVNYISNATSLNDADVKLDTALYQEANRAKSAEGSIDGAIGLTKNSDSETRTYTNSGEYIGKQATNTVASDIKALDTQVKTNADAIDALEGSYISGITMNGSGVTVANNVAALTATYTNEAANSTEGMVITTGANGGLDFKFGTLDCGEYV